MSRLHRTTIYSLVLFCAVSIGVALCQAKRTVNTAADLPRFSYPLTQSASSLLKADDVTFNDLVKKVETDVNLVLANYNISDKETLRELLGAQLSAQLLHGEMKDALATSAQIRDLQDKPAAKLTSGMMTTALVIALDPTLTPEQTIALMKQGATPSADGRMHLIDSKATIALLKQQQTK